MLYIIDPVARFALLQVVDILLIIDDLPEQLSQQAILCYYVRLFFSQNQNQIQKGLSGVL
jgi:hypothetical protein